MTINFDRRENTIAISFFPNKACRVNVRGLKDEVDGLKDEFQKEKVKNEERHQELLGRFKLLENDQDFIWEKTVRNEREIANIKAQLSNQ